MPDEVPGGCFCGAIRFTVALPTMFCAHCHCSMCRRAHGAGFVTWIGVARPQFAITAGEEHLTRYRSSDHGTRSFCAVCGSTLLCESTQDPERVDVVLANMEGEVDRQPEMHVFVSDRARWISITDGLVRLGGPTGLEPLAED